MPTQKAGHFTMGILSEDNDRKLAKASLSKNNGR